ncbi:YeeE/YedE family protein [Desulfuromonas sp. AOP6]|uniref:YeeE/YedE family protein n=1 Tax=Desulfuromonas sp. AOP6 TaxID=1566351 RepID=UPI00128030ED|nr:YeeE/YedE family protein [Desulfuromonas sp. AOP6]BCA80777.1 hypothetical protein AOP6_2564 [Desulfuromonas sp. AOP6]
MTFHTFLIVGSSLLLGLAAGVVMHRADFCIAGMFRDVFLAGVHGMQRSLLLLIASSMVLLEAGRLAGLFPTMEVLYKTPALTNLLGGFFFGIGMVLAGGCVVGTLYKMGAGRFPSLLAFLGLLVGSVLYAEIHPAWMVVTDHLKLPLAGKTLPVHLGMTTTPMVLGLAVILAFPIGRWFRTRAMERPTVVSGYLQPWKAALLLALIGVSSCWLLGAPLGVTTSYAKMGSWMEQLFFPEHVAGLAYFQAETLMAVDRFGGRPLYGGGGPTLDGVVLLQFPLIAGIVLGSAASAMTLGEFHLSFKLPWRQAFSAVLGGVVMGLASRLAPGCNIWHLMGGGPLLVTQSLLFILGLFPGAWLGSRLFVKVVLR